MSGLPVSNDEPTIRDVARQAGVSIATVSRALKNQPGLTEDTRRQVLEAAAALGYDLAKLRPVKARRIGFFMQRQNHALTSNPFYFPVLHGVEDACRKEGVALSYCQVAPEDNIPEIIRIQEVDALICVGHFDPEMLTAFKRSGKPVILVDNHQPGYLCVNTDNLTGAYQATQHLIAMGRKRIAFITGPHHFSIHQRQQGYMQALQDAGREIDPALMVQRYPIDEQAGAYPAMQQLLALKDPPDAVFAYNDETAIVAIQACLDAGLSVPEDIAIAGYDDIPNGAHGNPSLTTVHVDKEVLGREAVKLILHPKRKDDQVLVPVRLIIRQSTKSRASRRR
ncbi:LacI family DNA-binding transcriptional regulator [Deinococcus cellulosilyticus]|uniref:LacI family transcriptional regulator n=1 Tax=Deinococcus cellulosilyticus (strain DSM 18568 / NBRC 106333 / KACC 11606 / 5516J-15) TaxID=1223518 RepID=A0A511N4W0_DEIC1|nr:LacI family DNA-binding transcriptional regulator [Deinococcus cellulosilyticus]GEM47875.1 LacI family transcriptional regulator [Deinococcus cellulosilyticus NBRC 106333 = KACC 11606]